MTKTEKEGWERSSPARVCIQRKGQKEKSRRGGKRRDTRGCEKTVVRQRKREWQQGTTGRARGSRLGRRCDEDADREMKRDGTLNERKREGTCICMGKAGASRRGLEGERESDRDAATVEEGDQGSRGIKTEGGKRTERACERAREREWERERRIKREKEREKAPRAMGTGMALASLGGPLDGSVRNGPSAMPTHHGHTTMTVSAECGGRSWSP